MARRARNGAITTVFILLYRCKEYAECWESYGSANTLCEIMEAKKNHGNLVYSLVFSPTHPLRFRVGSGANISTERRSPQLMCIAHVQ